MAHCSKCGGILPENAHFCPICAAPVQSPSSSAQPVTLATKRSIGSRLGFWIGRHPILSLTGFIILMGTTAVFDHQGTDQQSGKTQQNEQAAPSNVNTNPETRQDASTPDPELSAADQFALNLERRFKENGYDIDARVGIDKSLVVTSDIFKDASAREMEASELWKERDTLCGLEIWYIKVGYSKGIFSSDVTKNLSLGCPAGKAARAQEMASEREKTAESLNGDGIRAGVNGTAMTFDSDFFSEATFRSQFVDRMVHSPEMMQKWCYLAVDKIQLTYSGKVVRTVPIKCSSGE